MSERLHGNDTPESGPPGPAAEPSPRGEGFEVSADVPQDDRILSAIAYPLPIVALGLLFTEKIRVRFVKYHAFQALAYCGLIVVPYVLMGLLGHVPLIGWIIAKLAKPLLHLISFAWLAGGVFLAYRAWLGYLVTIPPLEPVLRKLLD